MLGAWAPEQADISLDPSYMTVHLFVFSSEVSRVGRKQALCGHGISLPLCKAPRKLLTTKVFTSGNVQSPLQSFKRLNWTFEVEKMSLN